MGQLPEGRWVKRAPAWQPPGPRVHSRPRHSWNTSLDMFTRRKRWETALNAAQDHVCKSIVKQPAISNWADINCSGPGTPGRHFENCHVPNGVLRFSCVVANPWSFQDSILSRLRNLVLPPPPPHPEQELSPPVLAWMMSAKWLLGKPEGALMEGKGRLHGLDY